MGPRVGLDVSEKRRIYCHCQESNQSLYQLNHCGSRQTFTAGINNIINVCLPYDVLYYIYAKDRTAVYVAFHTHQQQFESVFCVFVALHFTSFLSRNFVARLDRGQFRPKSDILRCYVVYLSSSVEVINRRLKGSQSLASNLNLAIHNLSLILFPHSILLLLLLLFFPLALQPTVGFGLSNNVLPFFPMCHQLSPSSHFQHLKISFYFLFPSFLGSSPSSRPFQFLSEDLFGHPILLHSLYVREWCMEILRTR